MIASRKKVAAAGFTAAAITAGAAVYQYIDADGGGSVYDYARKYDQMHKDGTKIVVRGACYSSCTMAIGYPNACLEPSAVLGFHPAYVPYLFGLFSYKLNAAATDEMRRHYPPDALAVINGHSGLDDNGGWFRPAITTIKATEFPKRYMCIS